MSSNNYGIKVFGNDNKLALHSNYASAVFLGKAEKLVEGPSRLLYTGKSHVDVPYTSTQPTELTASLEFSYSGFEYGAIIPFVKPAFDGQVFGITDMTKDEKVWTFNIIFSGGVDDIPKIYVFGNRAILHGPQGNLPEYGLIVRDQYDTVTYSTGDVLLRVDDVFPISYPAVGNEKQDAYKQEIQDNLESTPEGYPPRPDQLNSSNGPSAASGDNADLRNTNTISNSTNEAISSDTMIHVIPGSYGVLGWSDSDEWTDTCGCCGLGSREKHRFYMAWTSYRGAVSFNAGSTTVTTTYAGEYSGAIRDYSEGGCGITGFLGLLVDTFVYVATFGMVTLFPGGSPRSLLVKGQPEAHDFEEDQMALTTKASYYD